MAEIVAKQHHTPGSNLRVESSKQNPASDEESGKEVSN